MVNKKTIFVRFFFKDNLIETYMRSREKFNSPEIVKLSSGSLLDNWKELLKRRSPRLTPSLRGPNGVQRN